MQKSHNNADSKSITMIDIDANVPAQTPHQHDDFRQRLFTPVDIT